MSSSVLMALMNHIGQSTLFALAAGSLTLFVRRSSARVRYCLWLAASVKFLVPFAVLTGLGALIPWPHSAAHTLNLAVLSLGGPLATPVMQAGVDGQAASVARAAVDGGLFLQALGVLWLVGAIAVAAYGIGRWMRIRQALRDATPESMAFLIPVMSSAAQLQPAVVGILRPVLLLPRGIENRLTPEQLSAILAHERGHVQWRDNLAAAIHMLVEALVWFHPLVWWLGTRIIDERERACDEQVLADGHPPESYAEGIIRVCEHYLESTLSCVAGAGGASLRRRIDTIMSERALNRLNALQKLLLAAAASAALAVPLAAGVLSSPYAYAQAETPSSANPEGATPVWRPSFRDADIRVLAEAVGRATGRNFIIDPRVQAQVTMISTAPLSSSAFYQAFQRILAVHGFKAEPAGDVVMIVPDPSDSRADTQALGPDTEETNSVKQLWRLNFKDTDIRVIAEAVGRATGKNFIIDPRVQAQVTMISAVPLSAPAFYQAFLRILAEHGFKAKPTGNVIMIVAGGGASPERLASGGRTDAQDGAATTGGGDASPAASNTGSSPAQLASPNNTALPTKIRDSMPQFPTAALHKHIGGSVTVHFLIDVTGTPRDVRVVESTEPGIFDSAAVSAVQRWRYQPAPSGGTPADVPVTVTLRFATPS